jgi:hypothetical protein
VPDKGIEMQLNLLGTGIETTTPALKLPPSEAAVLKVLEQQPTASSSSLQRQIGVVNVSAAVTSLNRRLADIDDPRRVVFGTWFDGGTAARGWRLVKLPAA